MIQSPHASQTVTGLLRRRRAWILATVTACVAVTGLISVLKSPTYEASALMVIDQRATSPSSDLNASLTTGQLLAAHYTKMATTSTVLDRVCADAGDPCTYASLKNRVALGTVKGTDLLAAKVTDASPGRAAQLANFLAAEVMAEERFEIANALKPTKAYLDGELASVVKDMGAKSAPAAVLEARYNTVYNRREAVAEQESRLDGALSVVEPATLPTIPADPSAKRYLLAGLAIGLVLALIIALLVDRIDTRIYDADRLSQATGAPLVQAC
ncbi:MAG TPA: Wzz/FepE/Etk N-terminal domain-containing protein [Candidatus Dormibacteraeota bacterium]|jgi:capsular polysaccharide biosynthesis protein|nr:Wzz/FepE/Etk N-terminal domain-containing protein [Candidatus Dormibacteraeota bacterium]